VFLPAHASNDFHCVRELTWNVQQINSLITGHMNHQLITITTPFPTH